MKDKQKKSEIIKRINWVITDLPNLDNKPHQWFNNLYGVLSLSGRTFDDTEIEFLIKLKSAWYKSNDFFDYENDIEEQNIDIEWLKGLNK